MQHCHIATIITPCPALEITHHCHCVYHQAKLPVVLREMVSENAFGAEQATEMLNGSWNERLTYIKRKVLRYDETFSKNN